jgi:hypothetical protein
MTGNFYIWFGKSLWQQIPGPIPGWSLPSSRHHSWASASRKLTPASAFRHSGIPASRILVRYRTKKLPDCVSLVRYRTCSGIVSSVHSNTGLIGCWTVQHSGIYTHAHKHLLAHAHTPMMCGMNMDVQRWHEAWIWTCTMDMEMEKHHGCRNADKKFSPASLVFR